MYSFAAVGLIPPAAAAASAAAAAAMLFGGDAELFLGDRRILEQDGDRAVVEN
jgi:hypothetical protein